MISNIYRYLPQDMIDQIEQQARENNLAFPYVHTLPINLENIGVFKEQSRAQYRTNIYNILRMYYNIDFDDATWEVLKRKKVTLGDLNNICKCCKININLKRWDPKKKQKRNYTWTGGVKNPEQVCDISEVEGHFFVDRPTNITKFALKNADQLHKYPNWTTITNISTSPKNDLFIIFKRDKQKKKISAMDIMIEFVENKKLYLEPIEDIIPLENDEGIISTLDADGETLTYFDSRNRTQKQMKEMVQTRLGIVK